MAVGSRWKRVRVNQSESYEKNCRRVDVFDDSTTVDLFFIERATKTRALQVPNHIKKGCTDGLAMLRIDNTGLHWDYPPLFFVPTAMRQRQSRPLWRHPATRSSHSPFAGQTPSPCMMPTTFYMHAFLVLLAMGSAFSLTTFRTLRAWWSSTAAGVLRPHI